MSRPSSSWPDVWAVLEREREQLTGVLHAMRTRGLTGEDAEDVLHSFALEVLPRVLLFTQDLTEDERGRYLRAALRNFVRSVLRAYARQENALERLANEVSSGDTEPGETLDSALMESAIQRLPEDSARAVRAFLGIGQEARSIREIARLLGRTRYSTKKLLQDGLLGAAIGLRQTGALSPIEVEACRQVILDGEDLESVAKALGLTVPKVRRALKSAREVVARALA